MHERRLELAKAGMFEIKRGVVWVPITAKEANKLLAKGQPVFKYTADGPQPVFKCAD
jgi:hypothetical protein